MEAAPPGLGGVEWVLSRPLYRFHRFDLKAVPRAQRARALALQVRELSPYAATGRYFATSGDDALVWMWDERKTAEAMERHGINPRRVRVLPETVLQPPLEDGLALRSCLDGFEGQLWQGGDLAASRWWPRMPQPAEWLAFQRDAGVPPERQAAAVPEPGTTPWLDRPWAASQSIDRVSRTQARGESLAIILIGAALALATTWFGTSLVKLHQVKVEREARLADLEQKAAPVREARMRALETASRVASLQSLTTYADPLSLMAAVSEKLPQNGTTMQSWDFRDGKLKVTLAAPSPIESSAYVKSLETSGVFQNVQAALGNDSRTVALTMDVRPGVAPELQLPDVPARSTLPAPIIAPPARAPGAVAPGAVAPGVVAPGGAPRPAAPSTTVPPPAAPSTLPPGLPPAWSSFKFPPNPSPEPPKGAPPK
ncbi:MAG TPA: hypothetical protein VFP44_17405 [Usitatibacter sp.]|nr:hypothetical protein [Usitatibacter sp.]